MRNSIKWGGGGEDVRERKDVKEWEGSGEEWKYVRGRGLGESNGEDKMQEKEDDKE